jgi:tRNA-dihydrouridine synthase B
MGEIQDVVNIIKKIKQTIKIPLSLKTRLGLKDSEEILTWASKLESAGVDQLVIHARTLKGMFREEPDWRIIKKLNTELNIPVIYNGGIKTLADALFYAKKTNCETLMIGQAIIGKPWLFKEIKYYLKNKKSIKISDTKKKSTILEHAKLSVKYNDKQGVMSFRAHLSAYLKGALNASELRREAVKIETFDDIKNIVNKIEFRS